MTIYQSGIFKRKIKKFSNKEKIILDQEVKKIIENPSIGVEKKGDLKGIFVHKFKLKMTQYLLAYRTSEENLELVLVGPHENYYRDLKTYIKSK